jgi:hypothetical protein
VAFILDVEKLCDLATNQMPPVGNGRLNGAGQAAMLN